MSKFRANIFLIPTTSNYLLASEVFKNQSFKSQLFSSSQRKNYPKLKSWINFHASVVFIKKIKNLCQFSEKKSKKWALNHVV